ncbi:hypothetical protein C0Q70_08864 [Pomacea canaliculata]|uniref:RING-type domain-containing protein n=1 Tax=Pomacea canaliculata TaxID=400727 RepID=A0A2T7P875_POMCA|nr:hypothetical protein C0Q70_08864 [Pomacea canaliculata]
MYDLLRRDQDVFMTGALHPVYMQQKFQALLQQFLLMLQISMLATAQEPDRRARESVQSQGSRALFPELLFFRRVRRDQDKERFKSTVLKIEDPIPSHAFPMGQHCGGVRNPFPQVGHILRLHHLHIAKIEDTYSICIIYSGLEAGGARALPRVTCGAFVGRKKEATDDTQDSHPYPRQIQARDAQQLLQVHNARAGGGACQAAATSDGFSVARALHPPTYPGPPTRTTWQEVRMGSVVRQQQHKAWSCSGTMATHESVGEEYLTCYICYDVFTEPKTLACLHRFCEKCLQVRRDDCTCSSVGSCT